MKWEAQAVRRENGQRHLSLPVFSRSFLLHPPLMPVTPRLLPPPPPSRPNASRRWLLKSFRRDCHHHHLPRIQTRAGGGSFRRFDTTATTTTSLASKREPEVVIFVLSTRLPQPPPPSRPNASRRWSFSFFRRDSHHHHLPRVQMRAGGGYFCSSNASATTTTSLASKREPEVVFFCVSTSPTTTTTSLASKREPEVVFFCVSTRHPPPSPPSRSNASRRWCFSAFRHPCNHHHLPRVQTRAGGGVFRRFDTSPTTTPSLASKRETEVVFFGVSTPLPPSSFPRALANTPLSFVRGFLLWPRRRGGVHTTRRPIQLFFFFCSQ